MTTLTTAPLASLLDSLFQQADALSVDDHPALAGLDGAALARLMHSKTDYLELYAQLRDLPLPVSRETGRLLYMLARSSGARQIVEFGTSFGISTLHLAAALRDNGGGRLITCEFEPGKVARARGNLEVGGLLDLVEIRRGDAPDPAHGLARVGRPAPAGRCQGAVPRGAGAGGATPAGGGAGDCRQRRPQP